MKLLGKLLSALDIFIKRHILIQNEKKITTNCHLFPKLTTDKKANSRPRLELYYKDGNTSNNSRL